MKHRQSEFDLQCSIVEYLKDNLIHGSLFTSFPLGGGGMARGVKLKKSGTVAGWPDIQILHNGLYFGLEVKTDKGVVSDAQKSIHRQLRKQGARVKVVRSINEVAKVLNAWHIHR